MVKNIFIFNTVEAKRKVFLKNGKTQDIGHYS